MDVYAMLSEVSVTAEPIDVADVRTYLSLRDEDVYDDAFLHDAIREARAVIEQSIGRFLCEATAVAMSFAPGEVDVRLRGPITDILSVTASSGEDVPYQIVGPWTLRVTASDTESVTVRYRSRGLPLDPGLRGILLAVIKRRYERAERLLSDDILTALEPYRVPNI